MNLNLSSLDTQRNAGRPAAELTAVACAARLALPAATDFISLQPPRPTSTVPGRLVIESMSSHVYAHGAHVLHLGIFAEHRANADSLTSVSRVVGRTVHIDPAKSETSEQDYFDADLRGEVIATAFLPSHRLVLVSHEFQLSLLRPGSQQSESLCDFQTMITALALSPDEKYIAIGLMRDLAFRAGSDILIARTEDFLANRINPVEWRVLVDGAPQGITWSKDSANIFVESFLPTGSGRPNTTAASVYRTIELDRSEMRVKTCEVARIAGRPSASFFDWQNRELYCAHHKEDTSGVGHSQINLTPFSSTQKRSFAVDGRVSTLCATGRPGCIALGFHDGSFGLLEGSGNLRTHKSETLEEELSSLAFHAGTNELFASFTNLSDSSTRLVRLKAENALDAG